MKKRYSHLFSGLLILSLYFINVYAVRMLTDVYINYKIKTFTSEQLVEFITNHLTLLSQQVSYYSLVFIIMFWCYLIIILILSIIYRKQIMNKLKLLNNNYKAIVFKIIQYAVILLSIVFIAFLINTFVFGNQIGNVGLNQNIINVVLENNLNIYILIVVMLFAPIVEEYIFRYGLINKLLKNRNKLTKVVLSAFIFSFIHIGIGQLTSIGDFIHLLLLYMPMSLVYCYVYVKEGNIIYPLALHMLNNIGSIILVLVPLLFI